MVFMAVCPFCKVVCSWFLTVSYHTFFYLSFNLWLNFDCNCYIITIDERTVPVQLGPPPIRNPATRTISKRIGMSRSNRPTVSVALLGSFRRLRMME